MLPLVLAAAMLARDVVIPPVIDPPGAVAESLMAPSISRTDAREVARLRIERDVVQTLIAPIPAEAHAPFAASTRITLDDAEAVRLQFRGAGAVWVAGDEGEFVRFAVDGAAWGPTTEGATVFLAAEGDVAVTAAASVENVTANSSACLEDVACAATEFAQALDASRAIAYIRFVRDGRAEVCTGALVSDAAQTRTPYLLTARHCIDSAEVAATVELIWDLRSASCGSNRMVPYSRTYGAELLVASEETDVALLRAKAVPSGRVFLGIDTRALEEGTEVHRVSHASGLSQTFAAGVIDGSGRTCPRAPRESFLYTRPVAGGIATGSSGAPLLVRGLHVAGQLLGLCGASPANPCSTFNDAVDGSIRASWPRLAPHLDPESLKKKQRAARR